MFSREGIQVQRSFFRTVLYRRSSTSYSYSTYGTLSFLLSSLLYAVLSDTVLLYSIIHVVSRRRQRNFLQFFVYLYLTGTITRVKRVRSFIKIPISRVLYSTLTFDITQISCGMSTVEYDTEYSFPAVLPYENCSVSNRDIAYSIKFSALSSFKKRDYRYNSSSIR